MKTLIKTSFIIILFSFSYCSSKNKSNTKIIIFSCIKCTGCVENNLNYIVRNKIHLDYKIIIDSNCYSDQKNILNKINFEQLSFEKIEEKYGHFGNFILIDSLGKKTEFLTSMNLSDFIK